MDKILLGKTAAAMVAQGKGVLAADESSGTCEKRFKSVNVECTEENAAHLPRAAVQRTPASSSTCPA